MASKAGTPFRTADDAAIAAIQEIIQQSISKNVEFAGRIYQRKDQFFFTLAQTLNQRDNSDPGLRVAGAVNIGTYHTHSGEFAETDEQFSPSDKLKATMANELSYLGTPHQRILKFTPVFLLPKQSQDQNPQGFVEVLINVWVMRTVQIVGNPNAP